jgi:formylglycine-generating enzyme required for sulfatase activity
MLPLPPGEFLMGSPLSERGRFPDETPHFVELTCGNYMSETEVTQGQYEKVMGVNPSCFNAFFGGIYYGDVPNRAVERVGWFDAVEFCKRLSKKENRRYRLPFEAEWEYACRAGTTTRFSFGDVLNCPDDWNGNSSNDCPPARPFMFLDNEERGGFELPVGLKTPNPWGFHDMYGHMSEWCQDWYGPYPTERTVNPTGPPDGTTKVTRGFSDFPGGMGFVRSACRGNRVRPTDNYFCSLGFRVVLELPECPYGD